MGKTDRDNLARGGKMPKLSAYAAKKLRQDEEEYTPVQTRAAISAPMLRPATPTVFVRPEQSEVQTNAETGKTTLLSTYTVNGKGKIFYIDAVENDRGKALRIAEVSKGKRTIVMIPAALLAAFDEGYAKVIPNVVPA